MQLGVEFCKIAGNMAHESQRNSNEIAASQHFKQKLHRGVWQKMH